MIELKNSFHKGKYILSEMHVLWTRYSPYYIDKISQILAKSKHAHPLPSLPYLIFGTNFGTDFETDFSLSQFRSVMISVNPDFDWS